MTASQVRKGFFGVDHENSSANTGRSQRRSRQSCHGGTITISSALSLNRRHSKTDSGAVARCESMTPERKRMPLVERDGFGISLIFPWDCPAFFLGVGTGQAR